MCVALSARVHLSLFGVPNKTLIDYDGYFVRGIQLSYAGLVSRSLEMFLSALDQLRLQERTRFEVIYQFHSGGREGASNNSSCRSRFLSKMAKKGVAKQRKKRHMTSVKEKKRPVFIVTDLVRWRSFNFRSVLSSSFSVTFFLIFK